MLADPADLTPAWLSEALQGAGLDVVVSACRSEAVGTGQMAHNERIWLEYARNDAGLPATLVGKFPSPNEESRASGARGAYLKETRFYTELASTLTVAVPACHYGAIAEDETTFTLLLEDLAPKQQGDQIEGASDDQIEAAVRNLAGLHATRWGDVSLEALEWVAGGNSDELVAIMKLAAPEFVTRYRERLSDADAEVLLAFGNGVANWLERRPPDATLVHGDYRLDNLLFETTADGVRVAAVDWQTLSLGCGGQDLAYLLGNSSPTEQRRAHEARMLEVYRAAMADQGVALSAERVRDDYAYGTFQGPLITMLGALSVGRTERGDTMFMAMASRCCDQIRDTGALDRIA
ncbi:MAG: phosphotransferase [Myxococcota bacterium]